MAATGKTDLSHWLYMDVGYRIVAGVVAGVLIGKVWAYLIFNLSRRIDFLEVNEGFVALSATLVIYGLTEP